MRRLLILLFAIVLPLQFTWASAAAFCEHGREQQRQQETGAAPAWHFGHHTHEHEAGAHGKTSTKLPDADCAICHFAGSHVMVPAATQPVSYHFITVRYRVLPVNYGSVPAREPDRPQWLQLA